MIRGRALHFVFKVGDRTNTAKFYKDVLGMTVLRHEEFSGGCEAACNGPYDNRWSKTMVAYGPEDTHFTVELTYNYGLTSYEKGNDYIGMTIKSREALQRAAGVGWPVEDEQGKKVLTAPGGYKFFIIDEPQPTDSDPILKVTLASSNILQSIAYWNGMLGLDIYDKKPKAATFGFKPEQAKIEFQDIGAPVEHAKSYGRIAFSCPFDQQPDIGKRVEEAGQKILTPLVSLDTPGKATVRVIILADPDGHEICFVDDEAFRQLSQLDPKGDELLTRYINLDKSRN